MYGGSNPLLGGGWAGAHTANDGSSMNDNSGGIDKTPAAVATIIVGALIVVWAMKASGFRAVVGIGGA